MSFLNKRISLKYLLLGLLLLVVVGCGQGDASTQDAQTACNKWGCDPNLTNFYEYQQMIQLYQLRDNPKLILNAYLYSDMTGQLTCLGQVKGFGIPYGTQFSPPTSASGSPIPEPNGLYPSSSTNADWIQLIDPATGKTSVAFVEPNLVITQQTLPCKPLSS